MSPLLPRKYWAVALATVAAGVLGWWSKESGGWGSDAAGIGHGDPPPGMAQMAAVKPGGSKAGATMDAGQFGKDVFAKRAEFDRILAGHKWTITREMAGELHAALQGLDSKQFELAIGDVLGRPGFNDEIAALIASAWAETDVGAASAWLLKAKLTPGCYYGCVHAILDAWSRSDSSGMFDWLEAQMKGLSPYQKQGLAYTLGGLEMSVNAERRLKLLHALAPKERTFLYERWAARDPAAATAKALAETAEGERKAAVGSAAAGWARDSKTRAAAIAWARQLPDAGLSNAALLSIGDSMRWEDGRTGAEILTSLPQTNEVRDSLEKVMESWQETDWDASTAWALQLEDEGLSKWVLAKMSDGLPKEKVAELIGKLPEEKREAAARRWEAATLSAADDRAHGVPRLGTPNPR